MSTPKMTIGEIISLLALASVPMAAQIPILPKIGVGQAFTVADDLKVKTSTRMAGKGLGYELPAPYQSELAQAISRTVSLTAVDSTGLPSQFVIKYNAIAKGEAGSGTTQALVGRTIEAHVSRGSAGLEIAAKEGKSLSDTERSYVARDAQKFIDYLDAAAQFSAVKLSTEDYQRISPQVIANLMGLGKDQVKNASVKQKSSRTTPTFDLKMVVVTARSEGGGDIQVSGTMTIETDWSSFDVVAESRTTRTSGSEKDQIQIVIDSGWSFDFSRKMVKQ